MWGFEDDHYVQFSENDMILILGARTTQKYGDAQLNVNPRDGKVIVNPS